MKKKSLNYYMRTIHRDLGFFVIGITLIYSISGIVLAFRDSGFLRHEVQIEKQLPAHILESELGRTIHKFNLQIVKTEGDIVFFQGGTYNKTTGYAKYTDNVLPPFLEKFNKIHRASNKNFVHWISLLLAISLIFLAVSSFWMFKPNTKLFRRGLIFAGVGLVMAVLLLYF